jgi:hypothetical protein
MVLTLVTAFLDLDEEDRFNKKGNKNFETCVNHFERMMDVLGPEVNVCVFTCFDTIITKDRPNIVFFKENFQDSWTFQTIKNIEGDVELPLKRNEFKDTKNFMILMNAKAEYVNKAIDLNPFENSTHYAWIDFSIAHVIKDDETLKRLARISKLNLKDNLLLFPTCWPKQAFYAKEQLVDSIYWRFCGGFFLGDKKSLQLFFKHYYQKYFQSFTRDNKVIWEVNYWAWLEFNTDFKPDWYIADHDDSILTIPLNKI